MPNIGTVLKAEISRLCRREIRKDVVAVKKASAAYRHQIAALKRQVGELQRKSTLLEKRLGTQPTNAAAPALPDRPVRFVAKGLRSLRARLGLSAAQLAKLIGVSEQSVYNWETKKATPRKEQFAALIALRSIGKREAHERLQSKATQTPSKEPKQGKRQRRAKRAARK